MIAFALPNLVERDMDSLFLYLSYFFASLIIVLALYYLYFWYRDQLQEANEEQETSNDGMDLLDGSGDREKLS